MPIDLFSLVLNGTTAWAIGRSLDAIINCFQCGSNEPIMVPNHTTSQLLCSNCFHSLDQYTNATTHTVNRNGSVAAAYISNMHWDKWGGFWNKAFNPHFRVDTVNSRYEDIVVRIELSKFHSGPFGKFYEDETILRPNSERCYWNDMWWKIPMSMFPVGKGTFAMDLKVYNTWGDELHNARSLGNWSKSDPDNF